MKHGCIQHTHDHDAIARSWVEKDEVTGGTLGGISRQSGKGK